MMDIQPAKIKYLLIDGDVIIPPTVASVTIQANAIWIRAGSLTAGTSSIPHPGKVTFEIFGLKEDRGFDINEQIGGNKIFVVTGRLDLYGIVPTTPWTRLTATSQTSNTTIRVASVSGWAVGDELIIGPTFSQTAQH